MVVLTVMGLVWSCCNRAFGRLGYGDTADQLVLTLVVAEWFGGAARQMVMMAGSGAHSVALEAEGRV